MQKNRKERLFFNAIHGITKTVDKIKDQKRTVFMKKEIEMEKAGFFKKMKKGWQGNSVNCQDVEKGATIMRGRKRKLPGVMKKYAIREEIICIN